MASKPDNINMPNMAEEPLEIRLGYGPLEKRKEYSLPLTTRTPGADRELGVGFLLTEGVIKKSDDVAWVTHCSNTVAPQGSTKNSQNVLRVELDEDISLDVEILKHHFNTHTNRGKSSLLTLQATRHDSIATGSFDIESNAHIEFWQHLKHFSMEGGAHAAALNREGQLKQSYVDIGQHNALDKLIGHYTLHSQLPMRDLGILISNRISIELVQKVFMAGCPAIVTMNPPSNLVIDTAGAYKVKIFAFSKERRLQQYC